MEFFRCQAREERLSLLVDATATAERRVRLCLSCSCAKGYRECLGSRDGKYKYAAAAAVLKYSNSTLLGYFFQLDFWIVLPRYTHICISTPRYKKIVLEEIIMH